MNVTQLDRKAVELEIAELMILLGVEKTRKLLNLPPRAAIDSVEQHRQWQDSLDKEEFFDSVFGKGSKK